MVCPQKLFFIGLMDVSDDRCPDNPEDSGRVRAVCQEMARLRLMWPRRPPHGCSLPRPKHIFPSHDAPALCMYISQNPLIMHSRPCESRSDCWCSSWRRRRLRDGRVLWELHEIKGPPPSEHTASLSMMIRNNDPSLTSLSYFSNSYLKLVLRVTHDGL